MAARGKYYISSLYENIRYYLDKNDKWVESNENSRVFKTYSSAEQYMLNLLPSEQLGLPKVGRFLD